MVFALSYRAYRRLIRAIFISLRAKKLKARILIVSPRITYIAASFKDKVSADCLFGLV